MMLTTHIKNALRMMSGEDYAGARDEFLSAISMNPPIDVLAELYFQIGITLIKLYEYSSAEMYICKSNEALSDLGNSDNSHIREALVYLYENAGWTDKQRNLCLSILEADATDAAASVALSNIYIHEDDYAGAVRLMRPVLTAHPENNDVLFTCAAAEAKAYDFENALMHVEKYLELFGEDTRIKTVLGDVYYGLGMARETVAAYEGAFDGEDDGDNEKRFDLSEFILGNSLYDDILDADRARELLDFRYLYSSRLLKNTRFENKPLFFKKLRVGYLSDDFKRHPVGYFVMPVMESDNCMESVCYSLVKPKDIDYISKSLFSRAGAVHDLFGKSNDELEEFILDNKPDIMMELKSLTRNNKLAMYAKRLAPVQISWIGFPCSSGVFAIDHIITDARADPYPEAQERYTEKLLYLNDTFLCYQMPETDNLGEPAVLRNGYITFGCFNNPIKVTDHMLKNWAKILNTVKGSKIILKSLHYGIEQNVWLLQERLGKLGFRPDAVLIEKADSPDKYYRRYDDVDIILDTYPFNGATTTFDALLMGTPLVTMAGDAHHSRVGLDLLSNVGLNDLICYSDREYIERAVMLAGDIDRLRDLKKNLRDTTQKSKLCDAAAFRKEYAHALRKAWIGYCAKIRAAALSREDFYKLDFGELRNEIVNGCVYILKCIRDKEFEKETRGLLLDELECAQAVYFETVCESQSNKADAKPIIPSYTVKGSLRDMDDGDVAGILEMTLGFVVKIEA